MPAGTVASRADALRVVEVIELLIDAGQCPAADSMYRNRCDNGRVWKHLPAARLGQRAAAAFAAPPRRATCATQLTATRLSHYMNGVGLFAMNAGDLATAEEYLALGIRRGRDAKETANLAVRLQNLALCLGHLGQVGPGRDAAAEALAYGETAGDRNIIEDANVFMGMLASLVGDTAEAEKRFLTADQIVVREETESDHLYSIRGTLWADFLTRTGRHDSARMLTRSNIDTCRRYGSTEDVARCDQVLGHLALAAGDNTAAGGHLTAAAAVFRDGDYLIELAITLADLAEHARVSEDLDGAERHVTEAIAIAAPRGLMPAQCAALAARARIRATLAAAGDLDQLYSGRDAADAAVRLAARHQLAWCELDALRAHALLDQAEGVDRGWAARAGALHARLVPPGLDPDPLATAERLVAEQKPSRKPRTDG